MPEMPHAREDHGDAQLVCGGDYVLILDAAAGLDDRRRAGLGYGLKAVGEGEKRVGSGDATGAPKHALHGAEAGGVHAAHLAGADAEGLAVFGVDDGVGLDVLGDAPSEEQAAQLRSRGRTPGDNPQG